MVNKKPSDSIEYIVGDAVSIILIALTTLFALAIAGWLFTTILGVLSLGK